MPNRREVVIALMLALGGCSQGPTYGSVAAGLPPVPPGQAQIFLYRWLEPYVSLAATTAFLNGTPVGLTQSGTAFYRDVPPGQYTISVTSQGVYPNQFKTVTVRAGQIVYARIGSITTWIPCGGGGSIGGGEADCGNTYVVEIIDPAVAQSELQPLTFIHG